MTPPIPRRTLLKGAGAAIALPLLDAMLPTRLWAGDAETVGAGVPPRRAVFLYTPFGMHMPAWTPAAAGALTQLSPTLAPLAPFTDDLLVVSGLDTTLPRNLTGGHTPSIATFLTNACPTRNNSGTARLGMSVDQAMARRIGQVTPLPSLELSCDAPRTFGSCDSYSCVYVNLSWAGETTPMPVLTEPAEVFEALFERSAGSVGDPLRRRATRASILDAVGDAARRLDAQVGVADRRKLDEYLTAVREIERRIARSGAVEGAIAADVQAPAPGQPGGYLEHLRTLYDLLAIALQADITRVATFMLASDMVNRQHQHLGIAEGHHSLSHHGNKQPQIDLLCRIERSIVDEFGRFLGKLKAVREGGGTLLDHSMILFGSAIGDGNKHLHTNLPILLAGRAGGALKTGRHLRCPAKTPLSNLHASMLDVMGIATERFADSTGKVAIAG